MNTIALLDIVKQSNNVIFILPEVYTIDLLVSTLLLARFFQNNGKDVTIGHSGKLGKYAEYLIEYAGFKIADIKKTIEPISYVIKIKDLNDQVNVGYRQVDDVLEVYITPENKAVDFSKIIYTRTGGIYDTNIYLGCSDISFLGAIYNDYKPKYEKFHNIPITKSNQDITFTEMIWELIVSEGAQFTDIDANLVSYGIIFGTRFLQNIKSNSTYKFVESLQSIYHINLTDLISQIYGDDQVYRLRKQIYSKAVLDSLRKAVYVLLSSGDIENMDIDLFFSFFVLSDEINSVLLEVDEKSLYFITNRTDLINFKSQIVIDDVSYIYRERLHEALTDVMNFISYGFSIAQNQVVIDNKTTVEENKVFQPNINSTIISSTPIQNNNISSFSSIPQNNINNNQNITPDLSMSSGSGMSIQNSSYLQNNQYNANNTNFVANQTQNQINVQSDVQPPFTPSNEIVIDSNAKPYYVPNDPYSPPFQQVFTSF